MRTRFLPVLRRLSCVATIAFALATPAQAGKTLRLASADFPPFRIVQGNQVNGSDADIVRSVFQRLGYTVVIVPLPVKRALQASANGEYDGFFTFTKNREREAAFVFSAPVSTVEDVFFKRAGETIQWRTLADLKPWRVGYSSGYNYDASFMDAVASGLFAAEASTSEHPEITLLSKLGYRRIDLGICEKSVCTHLLKTARTSTQESFAAIDFVDRPVGPVRSFHLGISRTRADAQQIIDDFNAELARLDAEGLRQQIFQRYGMRITLGESPPRTSSGKRPAKPKNTP